MKIPNAISDNPALVIGLVRAVLLLAAAFWPNLFSVQQQEAIIAIAVASLALTGLTVSTTVPKTPSSVAPASAIQVPAPASPPPPAS